MSTTVQSVLFSRDQWTIDSAKSWLLEHGFIAPKVDVTTNFMRFRQMNPALFAQHTYRNIKPSAQDGIEFVIGVLKKDLKKVRA